MFLDTLQAAGRSEAHLKNCRIALRQFLGIAGDLSSADSLHVRDFLDSFRSANTRGLKLIILRQFFKFAKERGWVTEDPSKGIPAPPDRPRAYVPITESEFQRVKDSLPGYVRLWAWLTYRLGSRVTETLQIKPEHLSFPDDGGIVVDFPRRKNQEGGFAVCVDPGLEKALKEALSVPPEWLFPDPRDPSSPITYRQAHKALQKAGKRAGVRGNLTPHRLRHSFATDKAHEGWNPLVLQQQLGHKSLQSTQAYYHPSRKALLEVYRRGAGG